MKETTITIPSGTKYLSEVMSELPYNAYINKGVTGCGGTTLALTNNEPYVVAVHSKAMVANKVSQLPNIFGVTGDTKDEDIVNSLFKNTKKYIVTYDSVPRLLKFIQPQNYHLLVDEIQVLIRYAGVFKIKVCNELLIRSHKFKSVSYLTATPTPLKYLPECMQDLDYVEYKWEDAVKPIVRHKYVGNLFNTKVVTYILDKYSNTNSDIFVFYNSVNGVSTAIKKLLKADSTIKLDDINIFFADSKRNTTAFTKHLGKNFKYSIPLLENQKRINFVSSMGFEGIDFYNNEVSVLVASDAKYKSMRYDISIDIPQIVGRFRNVLCCPIDFIWSSYTDEAKMTEEEFIEYITIQTKEMEEAIDIIDSTKNSIINKGIKIQIIEKQLPYGYIDDEENENSEVKINQYAYSSLMSSFSALHCDYYVLNKNGQEINDAGVIKKANDIFNLEDDTLVLPELSLEHQKNLDKVFSFTKLAKQYCELMNELETCYDENTREEIGESIATVISYSDNLMKYHKVLTPSNIKTACFNMKKLDEMYDNIMLLKKLKNNPLNLEEKVYSTEELKNKLKKLYNDYSIIKEPNTKDLKHWYDVKPSTVYINNGPASALKIISIK